MIPLYARLFTHCRFDVREHMAYSVLVAETAWPEVPETVKPSKKIREERLEILNKSHILRSSHFLKHSHILKPSHAGQLIPRARRQVTYETPHLQGPVRSASPAEPEENTSEPAILNLSHILKLSHFLKLSHAGRFIPRARRQFTYETPHLQGPEPSGSPAEPEENTSEPAILNHSHILKPSHAARLMPRARRQVTYETPHLQGPVRSASPAEPEENTSEPAILKLSHILKPSHAARLMPRARRQVPYETPHLQGPVRSASPAEPEENTSEPEILKLSHILKPSHAGEAAIASYAADHPSLTSIGRWHRLPRARFQVWNGDRRWS